MDVVKEAKKKERGELKTSKTFWNCMKSTLIELIAIIVCFARSKYEKYFRACLNKLCRTYYFLQSWSVMVVFSLSNLTPQCYYSLMLECPNSKIIQHVYSIIFRLELDLYQFCWQRFWFFLWTIVEYTITVTVCASQSGKYIRDTPSMAYIVQIIQFRQTFIKLKRHF